MKILTDMSLWEVEVNKCWTHLKPLCAIRRLTDLQSDYLTKALRLVSIDDKEAWVAVGDPRTSCTMVSLNLEAFKLVDAWMGVQKRPPALKLNCKFNCKIQVFTFTDENYEPMTMFLSMDNAS